MNWKRRRPSRAAAWVRCVWSLLTACLLLSSAALAQETEQPEQLMIEQTLLHDGHLQLASLLLAPLPLRGPVLAGMVEVHKAAEPTGSVWLRTSQGCLTGRARHGVLRAQVDASCDVHVHLNGPYALLRCHDEVLALLDLVGTHPIRTKNAVAWVPTTKLVASAARKSTTPRACTAKSLKALHKKGQDPGTTTAVHGVQVGRPGTLSRTIPVHAVPVEEDCRKPADTGDLRLLHSAQQHLAGRLWASPHPTALQVFATRHDCEAGSHSVLVQHRTAHGGMR